MNVLTLILRPRNLEYAAFAGAGAPAVEGKVSSHDRWTDAAALDEALARIASDVRRATGRGPETVVIRAPFGGPEFRAPVLATPEALRKLDALSPAAPLHVPATVHLAQACRRAFPGVPSVLVFETAFFTALPLREYSYGLDMQMMDSMNLRRYGFHGIFHEEACRHMARRARESGAAAEQRILSIVLEPKPELSAVFGNRPLTVTSGATPLEGIPGETSSGELDAGIVLALSREGQMGPEQINALLTRESGISGFLGRRTTFEELFNLKDPSFEEAREIIRYRLLLACGTGIAAMSGLDGIVFSGRYAALGRQLGPWLASKIRLKTGPSPIPWECLETPLSRLLADAAATVALASGKPRTQPAAV